MDDTYLFPSFQGVLPNPFAFQNDGETEFGFGPVGAGGGGSTGGGGTGGGGVSTGAFLGDRRLGSGITFTGKETRIDR